MQEVSSSFIRAARGLADPRLGCRDLRRSSVRLREASQGFGDDRWSSTGSLRRSGRMRDRSKREGVGGGTGGEERKRRGRRCF